MTEIYGLFTLASGNCLWLHAVSYDEKKLESILESIDKNDNILDYMIRKLTLYSITKTDNDKLLFSKVLSYKNNEKIYGIVIKKNKICFDEIGLLKVTSNYDENSLEYKLYLDELRKTIIFEDNKFSLESIKFDTYYENSIIQTK